MGYEHSLEHFPLINAHIVLICMMIVIARGSWRRIRWQRRTSSWRCSSRPMLATFKVRSLSPGCNYILFHRLLFGGHLLAALDS